MIERALRHFLRLFLACAIPLILFALPAVLTAQETEDPRGKLDELSDQRAALERELNEMRQAENLASDELQYIDTELTNLDRRLERTAATLETKQKQVEFYNESNTQAIADLKTAQEKFEVRLVEWYKSGAGSVLGSLMSAGDLSDFFYVMAYMDAIMKRDQETIDYIREQQGRIAKQTEDLQAEIADCERLLAELHVDEARYEELRGAHYARLSDIAGNVDETEKALRELEASSYEIAMMLQASTYTSSFSGGGMIPPIDAAITSGFGMRRHPIFGGVRMHTGVDMPAAYGTHIHAAQDGVVAFAGWKRGYGNTVIVDHGNGLATLYAHCSSIEVRNGERVNRGQVIAKVGSTGYSTGPHVHFEVRVHGEPVDPENYI